MPPKKKSLAEVIAEEKKKDKHALLGKLSEANQVPEGLPTGNIAIDTLTGIGGFPKGRIVELFGPPSSGKTTSALQAAANFQKKGGIIIYNDYEGTLDETYCKSLGIDTDADSFIYDQPDYFEEGANRTRRLMDTGEVGMVIFDSVATMVTKNEAEAETGQAVVADRAKMMSQFLRQTRAVYKRTGCTAIFLNHVMQLLDTSPMGKKLAASGVQRKTTPGGTALPFYSSLRLEFRQVGNIRSSEVSLLSGQKEDVIRQTKVSATVVKNKVGDPFGTAELRVRFGKGFSNEYSVFRILADYGVIGKEGSSKYLFPAEIAHSGMKKDYIVGENEVCNELENNPGWMNEMRTIAEKVLLENGPQKVDASQFDHNGMTHDEVQEAMSVMDSMELEDALAAAGDDE